MLPFQRRHSFGLGNFGGAESLTGADSGPSLPVVRSRSGTLLVGLGVGFSRRGNSGSGERTSSWALS
jgi:hypothetical protein